MKKSEPTATGATVELFDDTDKYWHSVCISFVNGAGAPVTSLASGTATGYALRQGADQENLFTDTLDLTAGERSWYAFHAQIKSVRVEFTGLPADTFGIIQVNSWDG